MTLHVTNGDTVVDLLHRAGLADGALAWADVLHEGPARRPGGRRLALGRGDRDGHPLVRSSLDVWCRNSIGTSSRSMAATSSGT